MLHAIIGWSLQILAGIAIATWPVWFSLLCRAICGPGYWEKWEE